MSYYVGPQRHQEPFLSTGSAIDQLSSFKGPIRVDNDDGRPSGLFGAATRECDGNCCLEWRPEEARLSVWWAGWLAGWNFDSNCVLLLFSFVVKLIHLGNEHTMELNFESVGPNNAPTMRLLSDRDS